MNKIRFMSIIAALMIASVGMAGCKDRPTPASSDDGEAVVTTTTTELVVPIPTTTTVTEPTTTTTVTTTTEATTTTKKAKVTTTTKATKKAKVTTTAIAGEHKQSEGRGTKATKKAKVTTTTKATKKSGGNLSVGGGTKPKGNTNLKTPDGQPVKKEGGEYYQWAPDLNMWIPYDPDQIIEKGGGEVWDNDGKGLSGEKVGY